MLPRPLYFSDLINFAKISRKRLEDAFRVGCPRITEWCGDSEGKLFVQEACDDILGILDIAFRKGLQELAQARTGRFGWGSNGAHLTFAWSPVFDVMHEGREAVYPASEQANAKKEERLVLRVHGVARAVPTKTGWLGSPRIRPEDGALDTGLSEWDCSVTLSVSEDGSSFPAREFYDARGTIYLNRLFFAKEEKTRTAS